MNHLQFSHQTLCQIFRKLSDPCYNEKWITPYSLRAFLGIKYNSVYQLISRIHIVNNKISSPTSRVSLIDFLAYFSSKDIYIPKWIHLFIKSKLILCNDHDFVDTESDLSDLSDLSDENDEIIQKKVKETNIPN